MGQWGRIKDDVMFGRVRQVTVPLGGGAVRTGATSAIPDCVAKCH